MRLPEFVTLRTYDDPNWPSGDDWEDGVRFDHRVYTDRAVAPDQVAEVHAPRFHQHEGGPLSRSHAMSRATGSDYATYTRDPATRAPVQTLHGRIDLTHVILSNGTRIEHVIGTKAQVENLLRPMACPPAAVTGVTLDVTTGMYRFRGDCGGDVVLGRSDAAVVLDPARLVGYEHEGEHRDEWLVSKVIAGRSTLNYRFRLSQTAAKTFTLQQFVPGAEPSQAGVWNDVTGTTNTLQAETRLRVKP